MKYIKICKYCGKEFETNKPDKIYCDEQHYRPCPVCNKPVPMIDNDFSRSPRCCSKECTKILHNQNLKEKECVECHQMFKPKSGRSTICDRQHFRICEICGEEFEVSKEDIHENKVTCSRECSKILRRQHNIEKYGVPHPMLDEDVRKRWENSMMNTYGVKYPLQSIELQEHVKSTMNERYGVDWARQSHNIVEKGYTTMLKRYGGKTTLESDLLRQKVLNTTRIRYGSDNASQSKEIQDKIKSTLLDRYGCTNPMQNESIHQRSMNSRIEHYGSLWPEEIKDKCKQTFIERYGVDNPFKSKELMEKAKQTCLERYGVPYGCLTPAGQAAIHKISKINIDFHDRLESLGVESEFEFYLDGKFYDLYVMSQNLLIEIDPTYTHNAIGNHFGTTCRSNYHLNKTRIAIDNGYRCIHVFDWDNIDNVVNMLSPKQFIYARKCQIRIIDSNTANEFLSNYHLQGTCKGQIYFIGLFYDDKLVELMTFGKSRYSKKYDWELLRLCTDSRYRIVGGASKLFQYATNQLQLNNIISYCDLSKFRGDVYIQIGMKLHHTTDPQEIWSKGSEKVTANLLRQRGYDQLFNTNYGKGTDNNQLMLEHGWLPVYDCGQAVYEYHQ